MNKTLNFFSYLIINFLFLVVSINLILSEGNPLFYLIAFITLGNIINYLVSFFKNPVLKNLSNNHESKRD